MRNKSVPEVRFPGLSDAWEQRELSQLASFSKGSGYTKGDLRDTGTPIILYGRLYTNYETLIEDIDTHVDEKQNAVISLGGEVIVPSSGESAEDIARASVVGKPGIILGGDLNVIRPNEQIDPVFLALAISNGAPNRDMAKRAQGKSVVHLHNSDLQKINLVFPKIEEQKNIVNINLQLDNLITLHQRELTTLKQTKQGFLQKMFPKEGESVPEVRFPGFLDTWKEKLVKELSETTYGGGTPRTTMKDYWDGDIPWIQSSDLSQHKLSGVIASKKITGKGLENSAAKIVPKQSIAIVTRVGVGKIALFEEEYATSQDFLSLSDLTIDSWFAVYSLYTLLQKELHKVQGTSIKGITKQELLEKRVRIPVNYKEQILIGNFFRQLDDVITLKEKELEALQQTKKAFLQKMFV